jgi:aromatic-L-amino-acid/L-tryptophan decarboxylase
MPQHPIPHVPPDEFRALGHRVVDWIADYHQRLESFPVLSRAKPGDLLAALPEHPPVQGLGAARRAAQSGDGAAAQADEAAARWDEIFRDLDTLIVPGLTHWQSPTFFGFYPCNASGPAILGEFLSAGLNVIGMLWATSPAATELEMRVLDWLAEMTGLPTQFRSSGTGGGAIQGTASESTLIAIAAARRRIMRSLEEAGAGGVSPRTVGWSTSQEPQPPNPHLVAYASTQSHSSVLKAAMIAGLANGPQDRTHLRLIDCDDAYAMRPDLLEQAIREDLHAGRTPFFVCATVGTTSSASADPVEQIADVMEETGIRVSTQLARTPPAGALPRAWLHVDAAYAGAACVCPEFRPMLHGVEHADSLCFNPHKWLLTNFDCDCFWTADRAGLIDALSVTPEYLRNRASESGEVTDFRDWQIPLGRRFRALKLWFVIRHYGVAGLQAHIREHVRLASMVEEWVRGDPRFEMAAPRSLSLVCFRLKGQGSEADARNRLLLDRLNATGKLFLTHTALRGPDGRDRFVIRMAIGATHTQERHVRAAWELIQATAASLPE